MKQSADVWQKLVAADWQINEVFDVQLLLSAELMYKCATPLQMINEPKDRTIKKTTSQYMQLKTINK